MRDNSQALDGGQNGGKLPRGVGQDIDFGERGAPTSAPRSGYLGWEPDSTQGHPVAQRGKAEALRYSKCGPLSRRPHLHWRCAPARCQCRGRAQAIEPGGLLALAGLRHFSLLPQSLMGAAEVVPNAPPLKMLSRHSANPDLLIAAPFWRLFFGSHSPNPFPPGLRSARPKLGIIFWAHLLI